MHNSTPLFSLVYTSVRANVIPEVFKLWNDRSSYKTHEWCIGIDEGDTASAIACKELSEHVDANQCAEITTVMNTGPKTCVAGWNIAATVSRGKILIAVADDFRPPVGWDALLLSAGPKGWEDGEYVIKVEDGYVHNIFVLSILTRKRYERFGYLFYPKYQSMFTDTEFGDVAMRDGVVISAEHLLFEHLHPDCGKRPRDGVDAHHASRERWNAGEQLYNFRKQQGFPIDDGPLAAKYAIAEAIKPAAPDTAARYVAYMQVIKDDLCLLDVCKRLVEEGVHDFCFSHPDAYWSGEPIEAEARMDIDKVVDALRAMGQTVHHKSFNVSGHTMPGDSRIIIETRVRNASLDWIRSMGYKHILIVDGDELWIKGTLDIVKSYVEQGRQAISVHMIPVIGVPGYPVVGATDVAVVYIGGDAKFSCCRSPFLQQSLVYKPCIYHFTGTRKGMTETVKKHRQSGHYDDPDYLFEEWIDKVLPNIKPGFKHKWSTGHEGLHMYGPRQIWQSLRPWRSDELAEMPESVRPYLGTET